MTSLPSRIAMIRAAALLFTGAALGGCGNNLAYVHNAVVGVDVTAATDGTARIAIGYDNDTFAIVPRFDPVGDGKHGEAMTLVSVSNVDIDALDEIVFNHVIATGEAAIEAARDEAGLRMMREAVFGKQATQPR
jgi:hypothetical protein